MQTIPQLLLNITQFYFQSISLVNEQDYFALCPSFKMSFVSLYCIIGKIWFKIIKAYTIINLKMLVVLLIKVYNYTSFEEASLMS